MAKMDTEHFQEIRPGRWRYVGVENTPKGTLTRTIEWDHEPTADELDYARTYDVKDQTGTTSARVLGPFLLVKDVGPPPWPWPKVLVRLGRKWQVGIGWRMTAYHVGGR